MNWIEIAKKGQPQLEGWYLVWDGTDYERALYKNKRWIYQTGRYIEGTLTKCFSRDVMTEFVTHYTTPKTP
jgi:hypothetical protein